MPENDDPKATVSGEDVYRQLQELRRLANMSQQQLATKLGMPQSSLARIEAGKGNPTLKTLQKIAAALDAEVHMRSLR